MRRPRVRRGSAAAAVITAGAMMFAGVGQAMAAEPIPGAPEIRIADTNASPQTNSLYKYLLDQQGQGVLFGHQHDTDNGITFTEANGTNSDVFAGTGDYPAMFGWDTLILEGLESPGLPTNTQEQNVQALADGIINADRLGGISTVSAHMKNFVTGKDFNDSSGRVVSQILPGEPKNADFNAYLDLIAQTANASVDADGNLIPIIFRPFHENTGSWFWWGAAQTTAGEYKEIFRYTVEYLRETKGVSNLLYAYSPNGSFGGDSSRYLATYPGDQWVDVFGYDSYENSNEPQNSDAWIATVIPDLAMVTDLAEARGKIPAFTEFGRNGDRTIKETGNKSLTYFTDLLAAIKADPKAKRITYMETWSNWELGQFYVPYPAYGTKPAHEMLPDFLDFYNDDYTVFAADIAADAFSRPANASPAEPTVRVVSPADGVRITADTTTVRVKTTTAVPTRVFYTVGDDATENELTLASDGYYSGQWQTGAENSTGSSATITVTAQYAGGSMLTATSTVILGQATELPVGVVDDFEGYADDASLRSAYAVNNTSTADLSLSTNPVGSGNSAVRFAYDFSAREYQGFGRVFTAPQDWSGFNQINAWIDPNGSNQKLVFQVNTTNGESFEAYPSLAGTDPSEVAIDILDFRAKSDQKRSLAAGDLTGVKEFWVYINKVGTPAPSSIGLDDIRATTGDAEPTLPPGETTPPTTTPGGVDDFEGYADDAALRAAWSRPGAATLSLSADQKSSGAFGAAFPYTPGFDEFQKSVDDDWSAFDQLGMWVKPDGNEQKIVLQLVAGGFYYDAVAVVNGSDPVQVAVPFAEFTPSPFQGRDPALRLSAAELANVQQLVMFIEPTDNSVADAGVVYLDDIRASVADEKPPVVVVPAASTTSLSISNQILFSWQTAKATVKVRSAGDQTATGEVTLRVNGKQYIAEVDAKGTAAFALPKLKRGLYLVSAEYAGDANTEASTSRTKLMLVLF